MVLRPTASDLAFLRANLAFVRSMSKLPPHVRKEFQRTADQVTSGPSPELPAPNHTRRRRRK